MAHVPHRPAAPVAFDRTLLWLALGLVFDGALARRHFRAVLPPGARLGWRADAVLGWMADRAAEDTPLGTRVRGLVDAALGGGIRPWSGEPLAALMDAWPRVRECDDPAILAAFLWGLATHRGPGFPRFRNRVIVETNLRALRALGTPGGRRRRCPAPSGDPHTKHHRAVPAGRRAGPSREMRRGHVRTD